MSDDFAYQNNVYDQVPSVDVPKTAPSSRHVEALQLNPDMHSDFDAKFGAGSAARYLSAPAKADTSEIADPSMYRPAISWSVPELAAAHKQDNPLMPQMDAFVDGLGRKRQASLDAAALSSVEVFRNSPPAIKDKAQWLDDEIRSAEYSVGYWDKTRSQAGYAGLSYNQDYERARARLDAARAAKEDIADKSDRQAEAPIQIAIALRMADQRNRVAYAEDQLSAAEDGDLDTGVTTAQYKENLRLERKKLAALDEAYQYSRQKKSVDGGSATGELGRGVIRSIMATTPEMLAGALEQVAASHGSETAEMLKEIAGAVKGAAKSLRQDLPAPRHGEIMALDPKSPEFANSLKLYAANALGEGLGSTAAFWAAAMAGGPVAAGGVGLSMGIGQMRNALDEEFRKEGMKIEDHNVDRLVYSFGTMIGALDSAGAMFNLGLLKHEVKTLAVRHMASAIARGAAKGAVVEGATEGMQEALQILGENYALERGMDWTKFRDRVIENVAGGAIPGMAFGAKGAVGEQGAARSRKAYDDLVKQIEAESKLEMQPDTAAPVSGPSATVSSPETQSETQKPAGRPLAPVQAEARDPATVPKPEPVAPQPETLSELSKDESATLLGVAQSAGIAKEGEAPQETLQRLREERAGGASFGAADAVLDRLADVETQAEATRANDATIQPQEVEGLMDMWRYVEDMRAVKEPEGIVDFLRRSGGVVDLGGDVRGTLGEANKRPGLISNTGLPLDAAARLAWDQGFLAGAERPDINALLQAIDRDLVGDKVVRLSDAASLDDLRVAREMEAEIGQFGIKKGMNENDVRNILKGTPGKGGSGAEGSAADYRGPQPRTIEEAFQKDALTSYLETGGGLDVGSWSQIADALSIEAKDVAAALDKAVADGLIRKRDGRYWRNAVDVFDADIPFALGGRGTASSDLEKHEQTQALVRLALGNGQSVKVPKQITDGIVSAMREADVVVPDGVHVGALSRIDPIAPGDGMYPDDDIRVTYSTVAGDTIETTMPLGSLLGTRAFLDRSVGGIFSARLFLGVNAAKTIAGEVGHEAVHARWRHLSGALRDRLVAHSEALGVLDMQQGTYLDIVGDPTASYRNTNTLREAYEERYAVRHDLQDAMQQEAVAHLVELAHHEFFTADELAPVADALAELTGKSPFSVADEQMFALSGLRADLDKLGYYSKALEAAKSMKQAKGTPEQMMAQLKTAGVKQTELDAVNITAFLEGKKSVTRDDLVKHLTENRVGVTQKQYAGAAFDDDAIRQQRNQISNETHGVPYRRLTAEQRAEIDRDIAGQHGYDGQAKWSPYSLDPSNPSYRETVLHLPAKGGPAEVPNTAGEWGNLGGGGQMRNPAYDRANFVAGHFPEPNIIGHMMTSLNKHEGKTVFTLDQIQSDWGQKLRDGGVRDEKKISEIARALEGARAAQKSAFDDANKFVVIHLGEAEPIQDWTNLSVALNHVNQRPLKSWEDWPGAVKFYPDDVRAQAAELMKRIHFGDIRRLQAELATAEAATPGNHLVNTTDQWTNTTLRRALRQAVEADADCIAIPHGDTVLSYNPGDTDGMRGFYGSRTTEGIVPKNLRKLIEKLDPQAPRPVKIETLETPSGPRGWKENSERNFDKSQTGFTLFPITEKVRKSVLEEGQPLFALSGYRNGRAVVEPEALRFWQRPPSSGDVLMFHGTRKTFDKFDMSYSRDFGVHFGSPEQADARLSVTDMEGARTIPAEITLKNAVVLKDPGFWGPTEVVGELMRAGYAVSQSEWATFQRLADNIDKAANADQPAETRAAVIASNEAIATKLNSLGIDGIWYRNQHEGSGWSLAVWNKGQVRSAMSNDVLMALRPSIANRPLPDGQRRVATAGTTAPAKPLSQLVSDLNTALGLTTRIGKLDPGLKASASARGGKLQGQYNSATDVTRLAIPLDVETLSHEGGHALEARFGIPLRVIMEVHAKELEKLATPGKDQLSEGFAEFMRRYVTNPTLAETRAPKFFKAFEQFIDKVEPTLLKRLHDVTAGYQDWINAPSGGAVLSTIKSAKKDGLVSELTKSVKKNGFKNVAVEYFHNAYTGLIDGLHPVKIATDKLVEIANRNLAVPLGGRASVGVIAARDPYKLIRLARNAYQGGHIDLMRGVRDYHTHEHKGPSLHDAIGLAMGGFEDAQWSDENVKSFGAYLISRRMVAEWNRFKAGELEGAPDKLSQADHIQSQKDFEQKFPQFIDAAEMVYAYQKNLLRKARDAGFVSEETYDDLIKRTDYVPAHRDMSEDAEETVAGPGAQVAGANKARLLKQFRGSTRDIINPLETIAKTTYEWNFLIARNDVIKALDRLSRAVGPGGGSIVERIPSNQLKGTQVNAIEIVKRAGKQAGMDEADLLFMTTTLEEQLGEDADTVIFTPGVISEGGEPIVYLWEGGKRIALRLADGQFGKDMYEAITGVGRENLGPVLEAFAKPSQWLRAGVTLDPAFVAANWLRDNPAAWINSSDHGTYLPRFDRSAKASADALRAAFGSKVDDLDVLASSGGIVGGAGMEGMSASRVDRDVKALARKGIRLRQALPHKKQFWELTGVTETGTRLAVFRAARQRALSDGLDEYEATVEAAYTANDLIDFGRFGSKMLAARRLFTFLNAFLQGTDKALRTAGGGSEVKAAMQDVISPYVRQSDGQVLTVLERSKVPLAAQMWAKMTMIGFIGLSLAALYKDDPEYEEIPEYFRNTHWIFKDPSGVWRRIPKPFELGAMSLVMERVFEAHYKNDKKAMKRLMSGLGDLVTPPHVVPGMQVGYELWANKSKFSGGPIVTGELEKLPPELQFTAYTSEFSKWMAMQTGVSAAKLDHAIAGITGSLGRSLLDKSNQAMPPVGAFLKEQGMPTLGFPTTPRPEQRQIDRLFVRRFTVDPARSSQSKKEFWKEMSTTSGEMSVKAAGYKEFYDRAQFDEASETIKRMKEHERVYALVEGHGSSSDKKSHPMNRAREVLTVTNGIRRDLDTAKMKDDKGNEYSPSDRRVIQEIFEQIQMREARNAQIVLGLPGFAHLKILPVEPVLRELEAKVPSIAEELDFRLRKARVKEFDDVREGYADLKSRVLEPSFVGDNQPRRKVGRRSP